MRRAGLLLVVLVVGACGGGSKATFRNPVYARDFPDPFVLKVGDAYYAYATNADGQQVQTATSTDLVRWRRGPDALRGNGRSFTGKTWAPEVLARADGTFVLYYTYALCVRRGVADHPLGPFVDRENQPLVCQTAEGGSIDPSPFRDDDGALYLVWKSDANSFGGTTYLYAQRLSADGLRLIGRRVRLARSAAPWEAGIVEAPQLWKEDGRYYLFFSGGPYDGDYYAVGYATCTGPLGPCRDAPENPILKSACRASGPGHQTLIRVGGETWMLYHAWPAGSTVRKRMLWLDRLEWKDGKPDVIGPTCAREEAP